MSTVDGRVRARGCVWAYEHCGRVSVEEIWGGRTDVGRGPAAGTLA